LVINNKNVHCATSKFIKCNPIQTAANGGINDTAIAIQTILASNFSSDKNIKAITQDSIATIQSTTVGVALNNTCSVIQENGIT
jgi:hypothetical protein